MNHSNTIFFIVLQQFKFSAFVTLDHTFESEFEIYDKNAIFDILLENNRRRVALCERALGLQLDSEHSV